MIGNIVSLIINIEICETFMDNQLHIEHSCNFSPARH